MQSLKYTDLPEESKRMKDIYIHQHVFSRLSWFVQALKRFGISKCVGMTPDLKGDAGTEELML